jgi:hypothetical protein
MAAPLQPIQALSAPALQTAPVEAVPLPTFATQAAAAPVLPATGPPPAVDFAAPTAPLAARPTPNPITAAAVQRPVAAAARDTPASPETGTALPISAGADTSAVSGARDAGARLGQDLATPPSLPASAPRLNLDLVRPRGGVISAQGSRGLLPMLPHPPEDNSKLAADIAKAAKADCRNAYSSLGLAAVVPLAFDALREKGCRW